MTEQPESLAGRTFRERDLRNSHFISCDLSHVVVRGSDLVGMELESPWLFEGGATLMVNGVDVVPLVDAELNRRFPGRELRTSTDPDYLRAAWSALERAWAETVARASAMPEGTLDASVDGEWSFVETLRHLVYATDLWLGKAILQSDEPPHPLGIAHSDDGKRPEGPATPLSDVEPVRSERLWMVRRFLTGVTAEELAETRPSPHNPDYTETVLHCIHTILEEEWEHLRYATRDLDALARSGESG